MLHLQFPLDDLGSHDTLPTLYPFRQHFFSTPVNDIPTTVVAQLDTLGLRSQIQPGQRIALTAGSRGIRDIVPILQACVAYVRACGGEPFVVPAMGSHGGATAEGQVRMLESLGITAESIACPIRATMDVVELGRLTDGTPVAIDRYAAEADGMIVINRIKAHTSFHGSIESGLAKMCAVGLGKREGAAIVHGRGVAGLRDLIAPMAQMIVTRGRVLAGLGIIEDAHEQTAALVALPPSEIGSAGEAALLVQSKALLPRLPFDEIDVLVVEWMGKEISGTGMDTNVIGRVRINGEPEPETPRIGVIVVLDLTPASHGNATGVGLADIITAQLASKIDFRATYTNNLTAGLAGLRKGFLPMVLPTPEIAIATAIRVCGCSDPRAVRLVRIRDTLHLEELWVTEGMLG